MMMMMSKQTKATRYYPGKAPDWANYADEEEDGDIRMVQADALQQEIAFRSQLDVGMDNDTRLCRLADAWIGNLDEVRADRRRIRQAEIASTVLLDMEELEEEEEEESVLDERRKRIKEKMRLREQEFNTSLLPEKEEEEVDEEEECEMELAMAMVKPKYLNKAERDTVAESKRIEAKEEATKEKVRRRLAERKEETKQMLVEEIQKEQMIKKNLETVQEVVDVANSDKAEYEGWKVRELARTKRDKEEREAVLKQKEENKKARNLTEEERVEPLPRQKLRFLQKHYHKGAFFRDEADDPAATVGTYEILKRDFYAPTGEDKMDKRMLPKVMQVKHFGRRGRVKWSHLVNEDTTNIGISLWTYNDPLASKYYAKMAGTNGPLAKPKGSKKLKAWETL